MSTSMTRTRRPAIALILTLVTGLALSACGGDEKKVGEETSPEEVMTLAKETLDETDGVHIVLSTDGLPTGVQGVTQADGIGTHAPAFDGSIQVVYAGINADVPIIAVDGKVFAQIPLTTGWSDIDPAEYNAPDPAQLMSTEEGFSSLLPATTELEKGESVRGGTNNDEVLTEYTGTVPADVVSNVIPSASGEAFDASYTISEDGELRSAVLSGVFYPDSASMTYTIDFDNYGNAKAIAAP